MPYLNRTHNTWDVYKWTWVSHLYSKSDQSITWSKSISEPKGYEGSALFQDQMWFTGLLTGGTTGNHVQKTRRTAGGRMKETFVNSYKEHCISQELSTFLSTAPTLNVNYYSTFLVLHQFLLLSRSQHPSRIAKQSDRSPNYKSLLFLLTACHFPVAADNPNHKEMTLWKTSSTSGLPLASETKQSSSVQIYICIYSYSFKNNSDVLQSTACGISVFKHVYVIYSNLVDNRLCFSKVVTESYFEYPHYLFCSEHKI